MNIKAISKRIFPAVVIALLLVALLPGAGVVAAPAVASRTLPTAAVAPGANFNVTITASGCGSFGQVVETLPTGFSYVSCATITPTITDTNILKFTFMGDSVTFTYVVKASTTAGSYTFSGIVKDDAKVESTVGGHTSITVGVPGAVATRTLPTAPVAAGANFNVSITASGCGTMGRVVETLPSGFSYVSCPSTDVIVSVVGNTVKFDFIGDSVTFTYVVKASTTAGTYTFSGKLKDDALVEYTVGGHTSITVAVGVVLVSIAASPTSVSLGVGGTQQLTITATMSDASTKDVTATSTYASSDTSKATVTTGGLITAVAEGSATITVSYTEAGITKTTTVPVTVTAVVTKTGSLAKGARDILITIPAGATNVDIALTATTDIDLELYDGTIFVIGWNAIITSSSSTTNTYEGDTFAYSGWSGGTEYITADGPLKQAYTLKVYGFQAGDYTVTVK